VRGRVALSPELDDADQIVISLAYETGGSCDGERAVLRRIELHRPAGERAVDFALDGPRWPPTYRGHLFSGCWYVEAEAGGEKTRTELVVGATPGPPAIQVVGRQHVRGPARRLRRLVLFGLIEVACVAVIAIGLVRGEGYWAVGLLGLLLLPAIIGTVLGMVSARAAGELAVAVEPAVAGLAVRARLGNPTRVAAVTATLVVRELAQRLAGRDNRESREEVLHEQAVELASDSSGGFAGTLPLPSYPEVPFTMSHSSAQVGWSLHVHATITRAPDQTRRVVLVARPAGVEEAEVPLRWTTG
jgi:hypothetical protein